MITAVNLDGPLTDHLFDWLPASGSSSLEVFDEGAGLEWGHLFMLGHRRNVGAG